MSVPPNTVLWKLEPHTLGKHRVLRAYLDAWLPILGSWNGRLLFIDGFAGPGEYKGGEEGSPIIALRSLLEHHARKHISEEVVFFFIEKKSNRVEHLKTLIRTRYPEMPSGCKYHVIHGEFNETMTRVLDSLDQAKKQMAPALVMIDPFGIKGTPMRVINRILSHNRTEVYISFMYEYINRFREEPEFEEHLDELFGCENWREGAEIQDPTERKEFFYSLYESQLRESGASQVVKFELYEGNRLVYAIFFGTHHFKGADVMKRAIWTIAPFGDFAFRGSRGGQLTLGIEKPNFEPLKKQLIKHFGTEDSVEIREIKEFVGSDSTDYHTGQLIRPVLIPMENEGQLEVVDSPRMRNYGFPNGTYLKFLESRR